MTAWLTVFYLGIFGAWLACVIGDRLTLWWREGREDLKIELVDEDDPQMQHVKSWRRRP